MKYWITIRQVQKGSFVDTPELGATRYLRVPDAELPSPEHEVGVKQWTREIIESFPISENEPTGDILFFVHGYHNSVNDADGRHRLVQEGLTANNFSCAVVSFDWPSGASALASLEDRDVAKITAVRLVSAGIKLFVQARRLRCGIRLHVLGHTTGAFAIREAFDHADDNRATATNWMVSQLVLVAGDVSATSFSADKPESDSTYRHCYRLTNYHNGYDEVLQISNVKRIGLAPRIGRVGLPDDAPKKATNVDCSSHFQSAYRESDGTAAFLTTSHIWYFSDPIFQRDLAITLRGAIDRQLIPTRSGSSSGNKQCLIV